VAAQRRPALADVLPDATYRTLERPDARVRPEVMVPELHGFFTP